ncbi:MAG: ABC transporter permease [Ilumatobacteraceae bacterium]
MSNVADNLAYTSQAGRPDTAQQKREWDVVFWLSVAWLAILVVFVVLGSANPLVPEIERNADLINAQPELTNFWKDSCNPEEQRCGRDDLVVGGIFGNDDRGRDVLATTVDGGRISVFIAVTVTAIGIVVGGTLGLLAGYLKGSVDIVVQIIINVTLSVPALLLVIFIVVVRGRSIWNVILAVSLLAIPALARIVRASTLQVADREFVKAAQVLGVKKGSILFREVLPNVMPTMISFAFLTTGIILVAEGGLAFLGLSVESPSITWGRIISDGRADFRVAPHVVMAPATVLFLTVLSLNLVGDKLLKRYDVREAGL